MVLRECQALLRNPPDNFSISDSSLEHDLVRASWLLYRGSSVVLNALTKGIRPIYVNSDDSNSLTNLVDPSLEWCRVCDDHHSCIAQIESDYDGARTVSEGAFESMARAASFGSRYFVNLDPEAIIRTLCPADRTEKDGN